MTGAGGRAPCFTRPCAVGIRRCPPPPGRRRARAGTLLLAVCSAAVLLHGSRQALAAQAQLAVDSMEIATVTFPGARAFPSQLLATALVTMPTRCTAIAPLCWFGLGVDRQYLDPRVLDADALRLRFLYAQQGYRQALVSVDTTRTGERVRVAFRIQEGPPVRADSIDILGAEGLARDVVRTLPLTTGDPLSLTLYEATRDSLRIRMINRGYAQAEVLAGYSIPAATPQSAHVRYEVYPGPLSRFGEIEVIGAEKVDSATVRRMLSFRRGDLFSLQALNESQRNLFAQAVFRHAEIRALPGSERDTLVGVRVQVNEGDLYRVRAGLGMSSAEYLNAEVRWTSRSFSGGARRLELRSTISNLFANSLAGVPLFDPTDSFYGDLAGSASADFTQPWFFSPRNTLGAGVFVERQSIPDVFVRTSGGGHLDFTRSLSADASLTMAYRPELTSLATKSGDLIFCIGFTACGPEEVQALSQAHWLAPLAVSVAQDRSNSIFAPTRGYALRLDAELASGMTGSDFSYARIAGEITDYHTIRPGWIWALRLEPGWAHPLGGRDSTALGVHPQKRFYAGGASSVRGFAQYQLGPKLLSIDAAGRLALPADSGGAGCSAQQINGGTCDARALAAERPGDFEVRPVGGAVSLVGNVEIRFPVVGDRLRAAAFLDFGQVWDTRKSVRFGDLAWTPGLGVRYFSPIGPLRVDVGYYGGGGETLTVVSTTVCEASLCPDEDLDPGVVYERATLRNTRTLRPLDQAVLWRPRRSFFDRLQVHLSIGQAF